MTNEQLYIALGVPIVFNAAMLLLFTSSLNSRFSDLQQSLNARLDASEKVWKAELHRVEQVLDARLKHLEEEAKK